MSLDSPSGSIRHPSASANVTRYQPNSLCVWKLVTSTSSSTWSTETTSLSRRTLSLGFDERFELEPPLPDWSTHFAPGSSSIEAHETELKSEYAGDRCLHDSLELREGPEFTSASSALYW